MKRFRFDLEKLLELRAYTEREAEQALARAMGELATIETRIETVARERAETAAQRFAKGRSVHEMRYSEAYLLRLDKLKDALLEGAAKAQLVVDAAREAFVEASKERKVLDKLKEKRRAEYRREASAEEIKVVDDIAAGMPARRALSGAD